MLDILRDACHLGTAKLATLSLRYVACIASQYYPIRCVIKNNSPLFTLSEERTKWSVL